MKKKQLKWIFSFTFVAQIMGVYTLHTKALLNM